MKKNEMERIEKAREEEGVLSLRTELSKSDNAKYTLHNLDIMALPPIDARICSAETLQKRCFDYTEICLRNDMKPSLAGLALTLNVSRQTLMKYITGDSQIPYENEAVLRKYNGLLNALMEDYMQNGKINPVTAIFLAKNNYGYKDAQEYIVNNNASAEETPEALIEEANLLLGEGDNK